jgi:hypothetical protein
VTETEEMWSERVAAWRASGKAAEDFTRDEPYAPSTLRWWSSRLRRRVAAKRVTTTKPERSKSMKREAPPPVVTMVKVVRTSEVLEPVVIEVGLARIIVGERFDASLLARVVAALGESR